MYTFQLTILNFFFTNLFNFPVILKLHDEFESILLSMIIETEIFEQLVHDIGKVPPPN